MQYKSNNELPKSIKKLPSPVQTLFRESYNKVSDKYNDDKSFRIAWTFVKKKFKMVDGKWIARGMSANTFTFKLQSKEGDFVQRADNGEFFIEGVLSDTLPDELGTSFTEEALKSFAKQINEGNILGGITHQEFDELKIKYSHLDDNEFIARARTERKGILKVIKAIYDKGKLWIKAIVDKRYANHIKRFKKMSIEAFVPPSLRKGGKFYGGTIIGLALDNNAINPRAMITSAS